MQKLMLYKCCTFRKTLFSRNYNSETRDAEVTSEIATGSRQYVLARKLTGSTQSYQADPETQKIVIWSSIENPPRWLKLDRPDALWNFEPNPAKFTGFWWYMLSSLLHRKVARIVAKELSFPTVYCFPSGEFYEPVRNGEKNCCRIYNPVCVSTTRTPSRL